MSVRARCTVQFCSHPKSSPAKVPAWQQVRQTAKPTVTCDDWDTLKNLRAFAVNIQGWDHTRHHHGTFLNSRTLSVGRGLCPYRVVLPLPRGSTPRWEIPSFGATHPPQIVLQYRPQYLDNLPPIRLRYGGNGLPLTGKFNL